MAEATGLRVYAGTQNPLPVTSTVRAGDDAGVESIVRVEEESEYLCE
jgi:hypothetical protein